MRTPRAGTWYPTAGKWYRTVEQWYPTVVPNRQQSSTQLEWSPTKTTPQIPFVKVAKPLPEKEKRIFLFSSPNQIEHDDHASLRHCIHPTNQSGV